MSTDKSKGDDSESKKRPLPFYAGDVRVEGDAHDFLMELLDTPAPSGFEEASADVITAYAANWADDVTTDGIGNVHVTVNKGASHRVMLAGHIDEIGFIITRVKENGLLRFEQVGGWDLSIAAGQRVRVLTDNGPLIGMIGRLAAHQLKDRSKAPTLKDLWIDIGVATADEARELVRIGDPVVLDTTPHMFANRRVVSRSADDRIGAFIALEVARRSKGADVEVVAVCTTREEIGCIGAGPGAVGAAPNEAIAIDVTYTSDVPGDHNDDIELGKGPMVVFGATTRNRISRELVSVAESNNIDIQVGAAGSYTGTDADSILSAGSGVPVGVVCVPTRYLHSPGELFAMEDAEAAIDLLSHWITRSR